MCRIGKNCEGLGEDPTDDFDREKEGTEYAGISESFEDIVRFCIVDLVRSELIIRRKKGLLLLLLLMMRIVHVFVMSIDRSIDSNECIYDVMNIKREMREILLYFSKK